MQKKVNCLRMLSARKDVSMEHNKLAADVALNELRLDKEASDTYHQQVLQLLQQKIEKGINDQNRGRSAARNPSHEILRNQIQRHFQCLSATAVP